MSSSFKSGGFSKGFPSQSQRPNWLSGCKGSGVTSASSLQTSIFFVTIGSELSEPVSESVGSTKLLSDPDSASAIGATSASLLFEGASDS